jgi:hypothetical protein
MESDLFGSGTVVNVYHNLLIVLLSQVYNHSQNHGEQRNNPVKLQSFER